MGKIIVLLLVVISSVSAQYFPPGSPAGAGPPGGSTAQLQYNNAGAFGGMAGTSWTDVTKTLVLTDPTITILSGSSNMFNFGTDLVNGNPGCPGFLLYINCDFALPPNVSGATSTNGLGVGIDTIGGGLTTIATTGVGGDGGSISLIASRGGFATSAATASTGGASGSIRLSIGAGGSSAQPANIGANQGGHAGGFSLQGGNGGAANFGTSNIGGHGSGVSINLGSGGSGSTANGLDGTVEVLGGVLANAPIQQWKNNGGTVLASIGATGGLTLDTDITLPQLFKKNTQAATAPGAGYCTMRWEAGTGAGTGKLVAYCGTSATGVAIVDNVGAGF